MKRLALLIALVGLLPLTLLAQTMIVQTGNVFTLFPSASTGDMTFSDGGQTLTIMGNAFNVADIDSIVVNKTATADDNKVIVSYTGDEAAVIVSGDIAPKLSITINGAHVAIVADRTVDEEITYVLLGTTTNGSFYMDGHYKSTLMFYQANITNPDSAAVCIDNGKRIKVQVADGTENALSDGTGGTHKACFFINGHAEFEGTGTLSVTGNTKHAYASDEYTEIGSAFGTLNILGAVSDGMHIQQYYCQNGGTVSVAGCSGDCVDVSVTKDATDENNGQVLIDGGTLTMDITAEDVKGLKADSVVTICGGTLNANVAGDGSKGMSVGTDLYVYSTDTTSPVINMTVSGTTYHKGLEDESKCRGIKVKGNYTFAGGTISMDVTGKKAKGISIDGTYTYISGTTNVVPE